MYLVLLRKALSLTTKLTVHGNRVKTYLSPTKQFITHINSLRMHAQVDQHYQGNSRVKVPF